MAESRHTKTSIKVTPDELRVVMPVPRVGCVMVFLGAWLIGWFAGEFSALNALFTQDSFFSPATLFLLVWLVGWTAGGFIFGSIFLLMVDGREILIFEQNLVRRRVEFFRWGLSWRYPLTAVENLRLTGDESGVKSFVSFDYAGPKGDKTIRVGTGLTENTAEEVVERVWAAYPRLMPRTERARRAADGAAAETPESTG